MFRRKLVIAIASMAAMSAPASAMEAMRPAGEVLASGRVVKVDIDAGWITIEHKPIWRFYFMESATRIFKVRDATMLTGLTPGDRIRFWIERIEGRFVVTWIENANDW
jgi:Cu(I)/Ag(I) efflux system protein CusF